MKEARHIEISSRLKVLRFACVASLLETRVKKENADKDQKKMGGLEVCR